jgi:hypothetical protein
MHIEFILLIVLAAVAVWTEIDNYQRLRANSR